MPNPCAKCQEYTDGTCPYGGDYHVCKWEAEQNRKQKPEMDRMLAELVKEAKGSKC